MSQIAPIPLQQGFWNRWNANAHGRDVSSRQAQILQGWLAALGRTDIEIIDVGCGNGWLSPTLTRFGSVTATDLSDEVLADAARRYPSVTFAPGDFMDLRFATFDVVVTLEVLSHVADQPAFVHKLASHLRPGGHLMMATQNRPVLEQFNTIAPPEPGQLRHWVDQKELRDLLEPHFDVVELFSVSPKANRGIMRWINAPKLNKPIRALLGDRVEHLKERLGLGWTLMALARKRDARARSSFVL